MKTLEPSMKTVEQSCKKQNRWNDSFKRQNAADSMKMMQKLWTKKGSKSKMLQIARKMDRTVNK